jgi:transposase
MEKVRCDLCGKILKIQGLGMHMKMHRNDFPQSKKEEIVNLYKLGLSATVISSIFKISNDKVYRILHERNIKVRKNYEGCHLSRKLNGTWHFKMSEEQKRKISESVKKSIMRNPGKHFRPSSEQARKMSLAMWAKYKSSKELYDYIIQKRKCAGKLGALKIKTDENIKKKISYNESKTKLGIEPEKLAKQIKILIDDGLSSVQIAKKLKKDISVVYNLTKKYLGFDYEQKLYNNGKKLIKLGGKKAGLKHKEKIKNMNKEEFEAYLRKTLLKASIRPNKTEAKLLEILNSILPNQYKYNSGEIMIGNMIPDFVNCNGQKKVIELFGRHWHKPGSEVERIKKFKEYGYDCLVIWDYELKKSNLENLKNKIISFNKMR